MRIAITDACIFIDLHNLILIEHFFGIDLDIHTSWDVVNELFDEQKQQLVSFVDAGKLVIHSIGEKERLNILQAPFPKALSEVDKTVLFLASKLDAIVVSSDKAVRNYAKKQSIEYHGMLWILDKLVELELLSKSEACIKLEKLIKGNMIYQNNVELVSEMNKRLRIWSKRSC